MTSCLRLTCGILVAFFIATIFSCAGKDELPTIHIITWDSLNFDKKVPVKIEYVTNRDSQNFGGRAKWRGGWSRQFSKKSFSIDLDKSISLGGLSAHSHWILNATYIDKTLMRHRLWYDLWMKMNASNVAAKCAYVAVYIDGDYQGLYVVMERIESTRLGLEADGFLFKDPQVFRYDTIPPEKNSSFFHQKYPEPKFQIHDSILHEFRSFLMTSAKEQFIKKIEQWISVDHVIDWHILLLLSHNSDGVLKNFYVYRKSWENQIKIIPWDYDHSAGRDGDNELNLSNNSIEDKRNILFDRLQNLPETKFLERECDRWWELRAAKVIDYQSIEKMVGLYKSEMKSEIPRNFNKWPYSGPGYFDDNDFEAEVNILLDYLEQRIDFLDAYFDCKS